jgi:hypothetical protein
MDHAGEEAQAIWIRHNEGLWFKSRPATVAREHREGDPINWDKTVGGKAVKAVKGSVEQAYRALAYPYS